MGGALVPNTFYIYVTLKIFQLLTFYPQQHGTTKCNIFVMNSTYKYVIYIYINIDINNDILVCIGQKRERERNGLINV